MGFYDAPLVISGSSWNDLVNGENQLYNPDTQETITGATPGTYKALYTDPKTGNVYTNKQFDFEKGQVTYDPYLNAQDLKGDTALELKSNYLSTPALRTETLNNLKGLVDLKNSDPNAYQQASASLIGDMAFNLWQGNSPYSTGLVSELEKYKDTNPQAYYSAQLALKAKQMGHNAANGATDRNAPIQQDIQNSYQNAVNAGLSPEQINSIISQNYQTTAANRAKTNATNAASGGAGFNFKTDMLPGLKLVGGALIGAGAADYLAGSAIDAASAANAANAAEMGPTYAELGYNPSAFTDAGAYPGYLEDIGLQGSSTGLDLGGARGSEMLDSMGLNATSTPIANTYSAANRLQNLSKLLSSGAKSGVFTGTTAGANSGMGNTSQEQVANFLRNTTSPSQANNFIGQYKMNQNPFTFISPGQTTASQGMYDVSGLNLANALRKA
jgi:hypothetical protein